MENDLLKTVSAMQHKINNYRKRCRDYERIVKDKNKYIQIANIFIHDMLAEKRFTNQELSFYFKKKNSL